MEKSMVQELSILTHSTIFSSRPSFLLPSDPDRLQLRKSRIQNLPGYRKQDLSNRLNFVVVFQTIEIERLSQQIETLRIMAKDADRQRLNFQNYEVQIRELTERCHAYEMHREGVEDQLERMKEFCQRLMAQVEEQRKGREDGLRQKYQAEKSRSEQLQVQIDRWRNRYTSLETSRTKELEQVRQEFQSRRRSQISRETRELAIKHQNQVAAISNDLRKAREELQLRTSELYRLQEVVGKFQIREEEMRQVEDKMYEYQNRFVLLSQENYRLNQLLRKRGDDIDRLRRVEKELKTKAQGNTGVEDERRRLQEEFNNQRQSFEQLQRLYKSAAQSNERLTLECQKGQSYEQLIDELEAELQRLNGIVRERIGQNQQLKNTQKLLQSRLSASSTATQRQFSAYEQRAIAATRQQERINAQLKHRLAENQQLKTKCVELEKLSTSNDALRQENEGLRGQLGQYNNKMEEYKRKIKLQEENLLLMEDIQKRLKGEEQVKRQMALDRDRLNATIRELTLKFETATQKALAAQQSLSHVAAVEQQLSQYRQRLAWMTQELDRVNNQIALRVGELQVLRENYRSMGNSKANYQGIEQRLVQNLAQMQHLVLELDSNRRENDRLQNDNMALQVSLRGLQGQIIAFTDEREDRNRLINSQTMELHELKQKMEYFSSQARARQQLEQQVQEQQKKMENYRVMYAQMQERLAKETAQSEAMVYELMQARSQPRVSKELSEELVVVKRQADEQRSIISLLYQRIETIQRILSALKQAYAQQTQQISVLRDNLGQLSMKTTCIDDAYHLLNNFEEKIVSLREQNFKLQSEKGLAGVQYCESMKVVQQAQQINSLQEVNASLPQQSNVKNSSIAFRVSAQDVASHGEESGYVFTFKEVHRQQSLELQDKIHEQTQIEEEATHSPQDTASMASSFINTLITKESSARFQNNNRQDNEGSAFGNNINSKLRYNHQNGYQMRYQRDQFLPIQREIQNVPAQINRAISPVHQRGGYFENAGIKRVVSYTHFAPTVIQPVSPSYQYWQHRDTSPGQRVPATSQSPNTVSSTNESYSQLGRRIRIPADPARLLLYRQQ